MKQRVIFMSKYTVPAIDHSMKILEYLRLESPRSKSLSEIAESVSLNKSTCFRILQSLQKYNIVFQEKDKTYKLGMYLTILGEKASDYSYDLKKIQYYLKKASELTNETCMVSQRFGYNEMIYIAKQESQNEFRINTSVGQKRTMINTSGGKCYLAFSEEEVFSIIESLGGLSKYTPHSIIDMEEYMRELSRIRERGYSIGNQEYVLGVSGVAVPILDSNQQPSLFLSLSCFSAQNDNEKLHSYGSLLKKIADEMSRNINKNHQIIS